MPRAGRSFEEGRTYHICNWVGGGLQVFTDEKLASAFVALLRRTIRRYEGAVFAWCLLGNHYHLIVRQGPAPLLRTMKTLQEGVTRARNLHDRTYGPLWQGRFKAKDMLDERYLMRLVAYVHLNPVSLVSVERARSPSQSQKCDTISANQREDKAITESRDRRDGDQCRRRPGPFGGRGPPIPVGPLPAPGILQIL